MDSIDKKIANARASVEDRINAVTVVVTMTDEELVEKIRKLEVLSFGGSLMRSALCMEYKRRGLATEAQQKMNYIDLELDIKYPEEEDS